MSDVLAGRYRIVGTLGGGGTSLVYRAEVVGGGPDVAIKHLRPQFAADPAVRRRFLREAELSRALDHPGIVRLLDAGEAEGGPFLVSELVQGETLRQKLDRETRLPPRQAMSICVELARALDHAHARGVIHRDVKPQNIFVTSAGVKLGDFGNARVVSLASVTGASLTWGTPEYVAPETFMRGRADPRADLYALGVVLHEMLTGRLPWTRAATLTRLGARPDALPKLEPTGAGPHVDSLISNLLALAPADRPASGEEVVFRLSRPDALIPAPRTTCPSCLAPFPDDLPRCLSCGEEVLRIRHDPNGRWRLVLERLEDDFPSTEALLRLLDSLAQPPREPLRFRLGEPDIDKPNEEEDGSIALPAILFSRLSEKAARTLEALFRKQGLQVSAREGAAIEVATKHERSMRKVIFSVMSIAPGLAGSAELFTDNRLIRLILIGLSIAIAGSTGIVVTLRHRRRRLHQAGGLLQLREAAFAYPPADRLLGEGASAIAQIRAPEVRALFAELATELFRLTRRAGEVGSRPTVRPAEHELLQRTIAAAPALTARLHRIAGHLDALDGALEGPTEGELMQTLARLERSAGPPGADREALAGARRDLETSLERRHATEQERARLSAKLCQMLGRLRDVCRRARAIETLEEQETRAIEAASAELDAFLGAAPRA